VLSQVASSPALRGSPGADSNSSTSTRDSRIQARRRRTRDREEAASGPEDNTGEVSPHPPSVYSSPDFISTLSYISLAPCFIPFLLPLSPRSCYLLSRHASSLPSSVLSSSTPCISFLSLYLLSLIDSTVYITAWHHSKASIGPRGVITDSHLLCGFTTGPYLTLESTAS
jgi:hypothetical protein